MKYEGKVFILHIFATLWHIITKLCFIIRVEFVWKKNVQGLLFKGNLAVGVRSHYFAPNNV